MSKQEQLRDILDAVYPKEQINKLMNVLLDDVAEQIAKKKKKTVAFLYLQQAVHENISIAEAFEKYQWSEEKIDSRYNLCNGIEYGVFLVPRKNRLDNKMPYKQSAFNLLDFIKEELHI